MAEPSAESVEITSIPDRAGGRRRVVIERVTPQIDCGRFAIKRVVGESVVVEADVFADGHDVLTAVLLFRHRDETAWSEVEMRLVDNDRWSASFTVERLGGYFYTIVGWVDHFRSWRRDLQKKAEAGLDVGLDLLTGLEMIREAMGRSSEPQRGMLAGWLAEIERIPAAQSRDRVARALDSAMASVMDQLTDRSHATRFERELEVTADPVRARYGAWYEIFPRSCGSDGRRHGTFRDLEAELPRIAEMGFDVLYLPPIHPIGRTSRKGRNNSPEAAPDDPGSPWAIGAAEGGHKAVHPELGSLEDFDRLVAAARGHGLEVALDIAFQCSPDHPYVHEHPEWFRHRADGSIQFAENPPKQYQDIYPFDFETVEWRSLWQELKSVFDFWIAHGVLLFRVDNPHTKAFPFWEWVIRSLKREHPELVFLSEAFTRPKVMFGLAKLGFTQSYNYFPWRNTGPELRQFMTELTRTELREFYRPNLWPNTPDILPQSLQYGGRPAFMSRLVLAATLGASYGIYGPAYELCVNQPRRMGEEEYRDSEKYELKAWDLDAPGNLRDLVTTLNRIRRENRALHANEHLTFHDTDNEQLLVYSKRTDDWENIVLVAVNLDAHHPQSGHTRLDLAELGVQPEENFQVHDLLTDMRYIWRGQRNHLELDPGQIPAAVFRVRRRIRSEQDFDYYM